MVSRKLGFLYQRFKDLTKEVVKPVVAVFPYDGCGISSRVKSRLFWTIVDVTCPSVGLSASRCW